jgi:hypothetical protein
MASQLLALLAASGLVTAGAGAVPATRAADAMPAKAALVTPISAKAPVGACFLPMKDGKVAKLGDFRKAKAAGQCADLNQAGAGRRFSGCSGPCLADRGADRGGSGRGHCHDLQQQDLWQRLLIV